MGLDLGISPPVLQTIICGHRHKSCAVETKHKVILEPVNGTGYRCNHTNECVTDDCKYI